jgi:hypothetical protein
MLLQSFCFEFKLSLVPTFVNIHQEFKDLTAKKQQIFVVQLALSCQWCDIYLPLFKQRIH